MARLARVIIPNFPHHITQRGNRRQDVFFNAGDYEYYLELLKEWCKEEELEVWAYCLMTNHVHLIISPGNHSNLSRAIGEVHRRYTRMINFREKWRGYLWQGRFSSFPMEESWLLKAVAYVELNPVKAEMVESAWNYPWSSAHAHLSGSDKFGLINTEKMSGYVRDWRHYLLEAQTQSSEDFLKHERTGRPLGSDSFIEMAESLLGRNLKKKKPGPKVIDNDY
jgi:putative transposase